MITNTAMITVANKDCKDANIPCAPPLGGDGAAVWIVGSLVSTTMGSVFDKRVFFGCYFAFFCVLQRSQMLQHLPGGVLLGSLLC